jgi:hypothetical protein
MFDEFKVKDLKFFAPQILEKTSIISTREDNVKKLKVPRIEEIMANIKIQVKQALGKEVTIRD